MPDKCSVHKTRMHSSRMLIDRMPGSAHRGWGRGLLLGGGGVPEGGLPGVCARGVCVPGCVCQRGGMVPGGGDGIPARTEADPPSSVNRMTNVAAGNEESLSLPTNKDTLWVPFPTSPAESFVWLSCMGLSGSMDDLETFHPENHCKWLIRTGSVKYTIQMVK